MVQELVDWAKQKYPASITYTGKLTEKELSSIEEKCVIKCQSVFMNGDATYSILYKPVK